MGGVPLTDAMNAYQINPGPIIAGLPPFDRCAECATQRSLPYVAGPAVEVRLKGPLSLHVDALYSRVDYNYTSGLFFATGGPAFFGQKSGGFTSTKHTIDRWEIPVLLKYTLNTSHGLRPFLEGGISIQRSWERQVEGLTGNIFSSNFAPTTISLKPSEDSVVHRSAVQGATFGVGASFGSHRMRPSVEVRYTRWFDKAFTVGSPNLGLLAPHTAASALDQVQLLFGILF
jgi:outer membrane protein with beta-barrel domain